MKKNSFIYATILLITGSVIAIAFKPAKEISLKTNDSSKKFSCASSLEVHNNKSLAFYVTIQGSYGCGGGGTSINFRRYISDHSSFTWPLVDVNGNGVPSMTGTSGKIQSEMGTWTGSVDIYGRTVTGNQFIKTVVFSTPQVIQNFTLDGACHCYGYTFVIN